VRALCRRAVALVDVEALRGAQRDVGEARELDVGGVGLLAAAAGRW